MHCGAMHAHTAHTHTRILYSLNRTSDVVRVRVVVGCILRAGCPDANNVHPETDGGIVAVVAQRHSARLTVATAHTHTHKKPRVYACTRLSLFPDTRCAAHALECAQTCFFVRRRCINEYAKCVTCLSHSLDESRTVKF